MFCGFYISTLRSLCVMPSFVVFCSSWNSCFPAMSRRYCLYDSEMIPFAPVITGITYAFTLRMLSTSIVPFYTSYINKHVPFSLLRIMTSGLLLGMSHGFIAPRSLYRVLCAPHWNSILPSSPEALRTYRRERPLLAREGN
jgi:hypothetical protein